MRSWSCKHSVNTLETKQSLIYLHGVWFVSLTIANWWERSPLANILPVSPLRYKKAFFLVWMRLNWILFKLKFLLILQMKYSSPALLLLYLVTLSSAEESKGKTPVDLKVPLTSTLVCCIYEFTFFCTTFVSFIEDIVAFCTDTM